MTHWLKTHSNDRVYEVCQLCCEVFDNAPQISQHHQKAHGGNILRRVYNCNSCQGRFEDLHGLEYHLQSKHGQFLEPPFKCHVCGVSRLNSRFVDIWYTVLHFSVLEKEITTSLLYDLIDLFQ